MQIPKELAQWPPEAEDELECLNLNITIPEKAAAATAAEKLPVLIWIYGREAILNDLIVISDFQQAAPKSSPSPARLIACVVGLASDRTTIFPLTHRLTETGPFAAQAIASNHPLVLVNPNYRLNLFAYGDGQPGTQKNLHVQDLQAAVRWTVANISAFGGDVNRITIAGESAGAILTHALCMTLPASIPIHRAILCSGSIRTSRFQPPEFFEPTLNRVLKSVRSLAAAQKIPNAEQLTLKTAPVPLLVASMAAGAMNSIPLQTPDDVAELPGVHGALERLEALMVGDCEFEGVLWLHGVRYLSEAALRECFLGGPEKSSEGVESLTIDESGNATSAAARRLAAAYLDAAPKVSTTARDTSALGLNTTQAGALSFMADYLFHAANHDIITSLSSASTTKTAATTVYAYAFDEPNPFAASNPNPLTGVPRAHHGVDLLALWGSHENDYPAGNNGAYKAVGEAFRGRVISFVNGEEPWPAPTAAEDEKEGGGVSKVTYAYAFGPGGECGEISSAQYAERRGVARWETMKEVGQEVIDGVWARLIRAVTVEVAKAMAAVAAARKKAEGQGAGADGKGKDGGPKKEEKEAAML